MKASSVTASAPVLLTVVALACSGGKPDALEGPVGVGGVGGNTSAAAGAPSTGLVPALGGNAPIFTTVIAGGPSVAGASGLDPCFTTSCGSGQRCVSSGTVASCIDISCAELTCKDTEECRPATGGGNVCVSVACSTDAECAANQFCNGKRCVADVCTPETRVCNGAALQICASNGSGLSSPYTCGSQAYFESSCSTTAGVCGCQDDWDCPANTVCESRVCEGTGVAPTCTLPPIAFDKALPKSEMHWGGNSRSSQNAVDATGAVSPFQWSNQVASTPMVANLDDDNGDGLIDELDFPEILFISHTLSEVNVNGVVRAIHGGGPNKGKDYFAACGDSSSNAGATWHEGEPVIQDCDPNAGDATSQAAALVRPGGMVAVGDLEGDGRPEIVVPLETGGFLLLDNRGSVLFRSPNELWESNAERWKYPGPAIVNLDLAGLAEIVVGNHVVAMTKSASGFAIQKIYVGNQAEGVQHQAGTRNQRHNGPVVCPADLITTRPGIEIVAGTTLYGLPAAPAADCGTAANPCALDVIWDAQAVNGTALSKAQREGFCAVADVLGAVTADPPGPSNPLDGTPEVIVVANGYLLVLESTTGKLLRQTNLHDGTASTFNCVDEAVNCVGGGAPNVDDFDGDGFPEVATAMQYFYQVVDFQAASDPYCPLWPNRMDAAGAPPQTNPVRTPGGLDANASCKASTDCSPGAVCNTKIGRCVCLQSGWKRNTEDDSSAVTSSSVFDFNGDGAAEVVYSDECYFRVYDGTTGAVYLQLPAVNRTLTDNPVVADVDNDGNAEIVAVQNNNERQCGSATLNKWPLGSGTVTRDSLPNGIEVFGDQSDTWVAARRIWNQHAYHVTNVLESGAIPSHEPENWKTWNGRFYNTYRSQPRNYDVAPDLVPTGIQVFSPNVACGTLSNEILVTVLVKNQGDLRVGPGVVLQYFGVWPGSLEPIQLLDEAGLPITATVTKNLEPGASWLTTAISYKSGNGGQSGLPEEVVVIVDANQSATECVETNNTIRGSVTAGEALADLRLVLNKAAGCEPPVIDFTLFNDGALAASNIVVRAYAGDPAVGGGILGETLVAGPIPPAGSITGQITGPSLSRDIRVWGVADPSNQVRECNDANNVAQGPALDCESTILF